MTECTRTCDGEEIAQPYRSFEHELLFSECTLKACSKSSSSLRMTARCGENEGKDERKAHEWPRRREAEWLAQRTAVYERVLERMDARVKFGRKLNNLKKKGEVFADIWNEFASGIKLWWMKYNVNRSFCLF